MINTSRTVCVGQDFKDTNYMSNISEALAVEGGHMKRFYTLVTFYSLAKTKCFFGKKIWVNFILHLVSHLLKKWTYSIAFLQLTHKIYFYENSACNKYYALP